MIIREVTENVHGGNCIIDADIWALRGSENSGLHTLFCRVTWFLTAFPQTRI